MPLPQSVRFALSLLLATGVTTAAAVDILPGQGSAPPPDLNVFLLSLGSTRAEQVSHGDRTGASADAEFVLLRYTRTFTLAGMPVAAYIQPSFVRVTPGGILASQPGANGLGDTAMAVAIWPVADRERGTYFGFAGYAVVPTGEYDSNRLANPGQNRYSGAVQVAYQTRLSRQFDVLVAADAHWYGANDDYRLTHQRYEQKALYTLQSSLMFNADANTLLAASLFAHQGAEEKLDGVDQNNRLHRNRYGLTASRLTPIGRFIAQYGQDLKADHGLVKEKHQIWLRYQMAWH